MTTIQDIIALDITEVFTVEGNTPISEQAVYTAVGGSAETAVTVLYSNTPLHGDAYGNYQVEDEDIFILGKPVDVSAWALGGTVTINSFDYKIAMAPFATDGYWSVIALRKPLTNQTKI